VEETSRGMRKIKAVLAYAAVAAMILLSFFLDMDRSLPLFFNPLAGPTPLRQLALGWAIVFFALSSVFFLAVSYRLDVLFLLWYGLGLALISSGLLAFFLVFVIGSPLAWAGSVAQYAGGIYLLVSLSKAASEARSRNVPLERILIGLLQKPRALFESLIGATTDAIVSLDNQGMVLLWNTAAEKMFGYGADEVIGLRGMDLLFGGADAGSLEKALNGGFEGENKIVEGDLTRRNGDPLPVEISISRTKVARNWTTTLIIRDITDRRRVEREMRQSMEALALERSLLNAVLEQMPAGVVIAQAETGKPILGNRKAGMFWMQGFREESALHPDGRVLPREEWPLTRSLRHGEVVLEKEIAFKRKDGTVGYMSANSSPIFDDGKRIIAGVITFYDISSRKEMEDELRRSKDDLEVRVAERTAELEQKNRELQDFAFIASHDLQEPLRKIQTFGDLLVTKFQHFPDEHARDYVSRMQKAAARMELLINSLLKYSRLSSRVQFCSQIDLSEAVRNALSNLEISIKETGGRVEVEPLPTLEADISQISQVFQNLIGNALKFHRKDEQPRVRIYCRRMENGTGGGYEICVEDNGIGFEEKFLDRIFMPFQRLHGRSEYNGVGMGLAICKKIVERHRGTITAKSTEGQGSTFMFTLPYAAKGEGGRQ
ncbi:MAG: PAS domain S-box protein, partial [Desulfobacterales bacterium]|nr:PAS domain S-box protein [Desulfobacterales bacterium]